MLYQSSITCSNRTIWIHKVKFKLIVSREWHQYVILPFTSHSKRDVQFWSRLPLLGKVNDANHRYSDRRFTPPFKRPFVITVINSHRDPPPFKRPFAITLINSHRYTPPWIMYLDAQNFTSIVYTWLDIWNCHVFSVRQIPLRPHTVVPLNKPACCVDDTIDACKKKKTVKNQTHTPCHVVVVIMMELREIIINNNK